jgi:hypothetical protein
VDLHFLFELFPEAFAANEELEAAPDLTECH